MIVISVRSILITSLQVIKCTIMQLTWQIVKCNELAFLNEPWLIFDSLETAQAQYLKDVRKTINRPSNPSEICFELFLAFRRARTRSPSAFTNLLRRNAIKIRKGISIPWQELGGVRATRGRRRRRSQRVEVCRSAGERRRFAAAVTAAHFPILFPGRRSVAILRLHSIPSTVLPGASRIAARFEKLAFVRRTLHLWARVARRLLRIPYFKREISRSDDRGDCSSHTATSYSTCALCNWGQMRHEVCTHRRMIDCVIIRSIR